MEMILSINGFLIALFKSLSSLSGWGSEMNMYFLKMWYKLSLNWKHAGYLYSDPYIVRILDHHSQESPSHPLSSHQDHKGQSSRSQGHQSDQRGQQTPHDLNVQNLSARNHHNDSSRNQQSRRPGYQQGQGQLT